MDIIVQSLYLHFEEQGCNISIRYILSMRFCCTDNKNGKRNRNRGSLLHNRYRVTRYLSVLHERFHRFKIFGSVRPACGRLIMYHMVALIAERQKGTFTNRFLS
ncbi:hypothetical protein HanXRQr2_Chr05g0216861 [Helianthus annuus]|uniref:Uncharacterized protein n=1 Tax=Helianthus annuus TaxID=4232 RepID=A0A9K3IZI2_HELAN|nr:hypothetical protein HanXRQr2_Chr05g0216861 [Helianthus annuus]KAJ0922914.1 hypothetical protein HanPSC8_Chr05g0209491 [Helianthus annuus]